MQNTDEQIFSEGASQTSVVDAGQGFFVRQLTPLTVAVKAVICAWGPIRVVGEDGLSSGELDGPFPLFILQSPFINSFMVPPAHCWDK